MVLSVAANAYELNNLDNEALDAPIFASSAMQPEHNTCTGFVSLPSEALLLQADQNGDDSSSYAMNSCDLGNVGPSAMSPFNYRQAKYQSAQYAKAPTLQNSIGMTDTDAVDGFTSMTNVLRKWICI